MTDTSLLEVIANAIRAVSQSARGQLINADTQLVEELGLDSLDLVRVIMEIENHFQIEIDVDEVPEVLTVADLAAFVKGLRTASAA